MIASANFRVIMAHLNNCRVANNAYKSYPIMPLKASSTIQITEEPKKMHVFDILSFLVKKMMISFWLWDDMESHYKREY